jgi:hypothetical protein
VGSSPTRSSEVLQIDLPCLFSIVVVHPPCKRKVLGSIPKKGTLVLVAKWISRLSSEQKIMGSIPIKNFARVAQLVEHRSYTSIVYTSSDRR